MSTQTVFRLTAFDGFDNLQPFHESVPKPNPGEILVKVRSVALNYRDVAIATGRYPLPLEGRVIPCSDMAGEVVAIGPTTTTATGSSSLLSSSMFAVGDAVIAPPAPSFLYGVSDPRPEAINLAWGGSLQDGVLREYIAIPAHMLIKLPRCVVPRDFTRWAATPCTVATVWNAFFGNAPLKPGETVLILGTGGVSTTALVLAKAAGATTIITSSSDEKLEFVQSRFGPDYTINYKKTPDWAAEVLRITNGKGVDHVIEVGGPGTMQQSLSAVRQGGLISVVGFIAGDAAAQEQNAGLTMTVLNKGCIVRGVLAGSKQQFEEAVRFMDARGLELPVDKIFAFNRDEIIAALKYVESGAHIGKVCIMIE